MEGQCARPLRLQHARTLLATPGPHTLRYGGNTSCIEVQLEGVGTLWSFSTWGLASHGSSGVN